MMQIRVPVLAAIAIALFFAPGSRVAEAAPATPNAASASIRVDSPWRKTVYAFAKEHFKHPAWGFEHSERDYLVAKEIAHEERLTIDDDVLFAAAFLHDMDGFDASPSALPHGAGSAKESEPLLRDAGFPMGKFPAVKAAMIGHMYYSTPAGNPEAIVLHDADSLEFLGAIGIARAIALIGDSTDLTGAVRLIEKDRETVPPGLVTSAARRMAAGREKEMDTFLAALGRETFE